MHKYLITSTLTIFSVILPLEASAAGFSKIYAFGDSLTDTGNVFAATGNQFPPPKVDVTIPNGPTLTFDAYFQGRFSNGPNWLDYFADGLGVSRPTPLLQNTNPTNGTNFAFGGATTGDKNTVSSQLPGLQQQIGAFIGPLGRSQQSVDSEALYIVWAGANDYLPTDSPDLPLFTDPQQTISNLNTAITKLAGVGAKNIMVVNLPDLGNIPRVLGNDPTLPYPSTPETVSKFNQLTQDHNSQLSDTLKDLNKTLDPSINLISFNVNSLFKEVIDPSADYGFTNITEPCLFSFTCLSDPEVQKKYLFWDGLHPTTAGHRLIANAALKALQPVPESSLNLGLLAIGAVGTMTLLRGKN